MKVPEVDSRMACGTSLMSYSPLPSSSVKPTVAPFIRVSLNFSEITIWPLYVVFSGAPAEIGMVLIGLAVLRDRHRLGLGVDGGDLVAADLEGDGLLLDAVDAVGALDAVEVELQR